MGAVHLMTDHFAKFKVGDRVQVLESSRLKRVRAGWRGRVTEVIPALLADGVWVALDIGWVVMFSEGHLKKIGHESPPPAPWAPPVPPVTTATDLPAEELRRAKDLARVVWDDGTHGEPASTLASYVLALLGEPPFPKKPDEDSGAARVPDPMFWIGGTDADENERRT